MHWILAMQNSLPPLVVDQRGGFLFVKSFNDNCLLEFINGRN